MSVLKEIAPCCQSVGTAHWTTASVLKSLLHCQVIYYFYFIYLFETLLCFIGQNSREFYQTFRCFPYYIKYSILYVSLNCNLIVCFIFPFQKGANADEPHGFFFMSDDALTNDKLVLLIHGINIRAGQWSRR